MLNLTPKEIVSELDRYVIGQDDAKRRVAVALRNRWRRKQIKEDEISKEIYPHNVLMVGPTGVGKTEIARRLAKIVNAPFIKVEATKFTEIGYVGRDVDSIIRDLVEKSILNIREEMRSQKVGEAKAAVEDILVDVLVGENSSDSTKSKYRELLYKGKLDDKEVEIEVPDNSSAASMMPTFDVPGAPGSQMGMVNLGDILGKMGEGQKTKNVTLTVREAYETLLKLESAKLVDEEKVSIDAVKAVEEYGIVFIDEIDKLTSREGAKGPDVNREGVQRDLLPLIEGTTVSTKHGSIKTDHILFISSGAFHLAKPSDLLPELQGRFPVRVELNSLSEKDMYHILKDPQHSLPNQYSALLSVEGVELKFTDTGLKKLAHLAHNINNNVENIGARRLHSIIEELFKDLNFNAEKHSGSKVVIDKKYIEAHLVGITKEIDLKNFIL